MSAGANIERQAFDLYVVCLGATLTSILSQYLYVRLDTDWLGFAETTSRQIDVSRFGAQVYSGIWFSCCWHDYCHRTAGDQGINNSGRPVGIACRGLPSVPGFYECVVIAFVLMFLCIHFLAGT